MQIDGTDSLHQVFSCKACRSGYWHRTEAFWPSSFRSSSSGCSQEPEKKPSSQGAPIHHCRGERWGLPPGEVPSFTLTTRLRDDGLWPQHPLALALPSSRSPHAHLPSFPISGPIPSVLLPRPSPEARSTSRTSGSRCVASQAMACPPEPGWEQGIPWGEGARAPQPVWEEMLRKVKASGGQVGAQEEGGPCRGCVWAWMEASGDSVSTSGLRVSFFSPSGCSPPTRVVKAWEETMVK